MKLRANFNDDIAILYLNVLSQYTCEWQYSTTEIRTHPHLL
jgi:hypothetical protein